MIIGLMSPKLLKTHTALDNAAIELYGFGTDITEVGIVAKLMERYNELRENKKCQRSLL